MNFFFFIFFILTQGHVIDFREREKEGEREAGKHHLERETGCLSCVPDQRLFYVAQSDNPGMCPAQNWTQDPSVYKTTLQPTEPHQPELCELLDFIIQDKHKSTSAASENTDQAPMKIALCLLHHKQSSSSSQACLCTWYQFICTLSESSHSNKWCQADRKSTQPLPWRTVHHPASEDESILGTWSIPIQCHWYRSGQEVGSRVGMW